jgi:hypothetical protein
VREHRRRNECGRVRIAYSLAEKGLRAADAFNSIPGTEWQIAMRNFDRKGMIHRIASTRASIA